MRADIDLQLSVLEKDYRSRYTKMKRQLRYVRRALDECQGLTDQDLQRLVDLIGDNRSDFEQEFYNITQKEQVGGIGSRFYKIVQTTIAWSSQKPNTAIKIGSLPPMEDVEFCASLEPLVEERPVFLAPIKELKSTMVGILEEKIKKLERIWEEIRDYLQSGMRMEIRKRFSERAEQERLAAWKHLHQEIASHLTSSPRREGSPKQASVRYTIRQLEIRQDDIKAASENKSHVCKPVIRTFRPTPFTLSKDVTMRDYCLMAIEDSLYLKLYLDRINAMDSTVAADKSKRIHLEKTGRGALFAVEENKKLLAILANHLMQEPSTHEVVLLISPDGIQRPTSLPSLSSLSYLGVKNCLLPKRTGRVLEGKIVNAASSPDGACLFVKLDKENVIKNVPESSPMVVSSLGHRSITHLIFLDPDNNACRSLLMQVTHKSSEFSFRSDHSSVLNEGSGRETINNSLIDCHAEVWTRFPVHAPIKRETTEAAIHLPRSVNFVSSAPAHSFAPYFSTMIKEFEVKTRKPTKGMLRQMKVLAGSEWDPTTTPSPVSELQAGDWLVGLFCLIPIHLAITKSNRFVPLKDGVSSPDFERSLLGANVAQISEA
ncbi:2164_t:CDS:2 [Acaulospora colombiana]|uniref:2164_t:CDS:1 n=1 Tax=Acaulospora colombiana TaxID=27376 RepID=A0ACA9LXU7_9GLOM|nr:2164_t:CDS:2 [Acaulospora colombiana]